MINIFEQLDDIDREAIREGSAISRLNYHTGRMKRRIVVKKNDKKHIPKEPEIDILRILNILQAK